jgi:hypothetical protein
MQFNAAYPLYPFWPFRPRAYISCLLGTRYFSDKVKSPSCDSGPFQSNYYFNYIIPFVENHATLALSELTLTNK